MTKIWIYVMLCMGVSGLNGNVLNKNDFLESDGLRAADEVDEDHIPREFLLSWQARKALRKIFDQMACGWPELGIPPLAPFTMDQYTLNLQDNVTKTFMNLQNLEVQGLDKMEINDLGISLTESKVFFDLNFPKITSTGDFNISSLLATANIVGLNLSLKGTGLLDLILENLGLKGSFGYELPVLWGSSSISDLQTNLVVDVVHSQLKGKLNGLPITKYLNGLLENYIKKGFESYSFLLNPLMEQTLIPKINAQLEGKRLWDLLRWAWEDKPSECGGESN